MRWIEALDNYVSNKDSRPGEEFSQIYANSKHQKNRNFEMTNCFIKSFLSDVYNLAILDLKSNDSKCQNRWMTGSKLS